MNETIDSTQTVLTVAHKLDANAKLIEIKRLRTESANYMGVFEFEFNKRDKLRELSAKAYGIFVQIKEDPEMRKTLLREISAEEIYTPKKGEKLSILLARYLFGMADSRPISVQSTCWDYAASEGVHDFNQLLLDKGGFEGVRQLAVKKAADAAAAAAGTTPADPKDLALTQLRNAPTVNADAIPMNGKRFKVLIAIQDEDDETIIDIKDAQLSDKQAEAVLLQFKRAVEPKKNK